jgi:ATP-binding cassette subfamily B (MDR/TAP) protein 1
MSHGIHLTKIQCPSITDELERMSRIPFASAIGSNVYAMICTHSDISYAHNVTSGYQFDLGEGHWRTVKNVLGSGP